MVGHVNGFLSSNTQDFIEVDWLSQCAALRAIPEL